MGIAERVWLCRMIEKLEKQPDFGRKIGLENHSKLREEERGNKT